MLVSRGRLELFSASEIIQAAVAVVVITGPHNNAPIFLLITEGESRSRRVRSALHVSATVAIILAVAAIAGRGVLDVLGISLSAFGVAGGIIVTLTDLHMLTGSATNFQSEGSEGQSPDDTLLVPFSMPLVAGPGSITVVITIAAAHDTWESTVTALIAVGVASVVMLVTLVAASEWLGRMSERTMGLMFRFGGLILTAIGVQLALSGIQSFFGI